MDAKRRLDDLPRTEICGFAKVRQAAENRERILAQIASERHARHTAARVSSAGA
jgi:hypothetical protein